jgi:hypothetical protein
VLSDIEERSATMRNHVRRNLLPCLAAGLAVLTGGSWGSLALAGFVPGGGNSAADCYLGLDVTGVTASGGRIECTEGDPCDTGPCGDEKCDFAFTMCVNQPGVAGCTPPAGGLTSVNAPRPLRDGVPTVLTGAACGSPLSLELKLKKNGQKSNKRAIRPKATAASGARPRRDQDSFLFVCLPRTTACPASPNGAFLF